MSQSAAQAQAFFDEAVRNRRVWTVGDEDGYPAPKNQSQRRAQPFWSSHTRAQRVVDNVPAYRNFDVEEIPLDQWQAEWLPGLRNDGILVGVNWTGPRATGYDMEPDEVIERLSVAQR